HHEVGPSEHPFAVLGIRGRHQTEFEEVTGEGSDGAHEQVGHEGAGTGDEDEQSQQGRHGQRDLWASSTSHRSRCPSRVAMVSVICEMYLMPLLTPVSADPVNSRVSTAMTR